jgi:hypothetical protein
MDLSTNVSLAPEFARFSDFSTSCARAEKKCAASPGGTFLNCIARPCDFQHAPDLDEKDSLSPQVTIPKEKLLVAVHWQLQTLAGESLHIVAFG